MSWLNFNESLNSIKGQLSSIASGVLAEGVVSSSGDDPSRDFEINDCNVRQSSTRDDTNWLWDSPKEVASKRDTLVEDLRHKVDRLEDEKRELLNSLEQLDLDHQQTTSELVGLRDDLQKRHEELIADFERLKREYGEVLTENMEKSRQIELMRPNELHNSLEQLDLNHEQTTSELRDDLQKRHDELTADFERLKREHEEVLMENMKKSREIESMRTSDDWQRKVDALNAELNEMKAERDANRADDVIREACGRVWSNFKSEKEVLVKLLEGVREDFLSVADDIQKLSELQRVLERQKIGSDPMRPALHGKYLGIITDCMEKYTNTALTSTLSADEEPEIIEFANEVENLLRLLIDFKSKTEALEAEICVIAGEKTKIINEKNFEIEKLLRNSEILSQEVITKTQALKDYENECNELMKNNDLLILELENFKNSRLQTISEMNEENMLLMESQLENANKKIEDMELIITDLENSKQESNVEVQSELDYIKRQLNITGQELSESKTGQQELMVCCHDLEEEKCSLKRALDKAKADYENIEYKSNEAFVALESLKEENEELKRTVEKMASLERTTNEQAIEIKEYTERLRLAKINETGAKLQIDTMGKELESKRQLEAALENSRLHSEELQNRIVLLETQLAQSSEARTELTRLLTEKHEENVRYHTEIERLVTLETGASERDRDLEKLTDQNAFLREKCEVITRDLLREQSNTQEQLTAVERKGKELERLRAHLVEVEEMYTQELVQAEAKNKEMQAKVNDIETREKNANYLHTSVNIRANQQVETLQTQLQLVSNQRDELRLKISDIEDENNRHIAALTNLQLVLEQFQKEKDKDVHEETARIRRQISLEQKIQDSLKEENSGLRSQLEESKQGLQAAARLTDQLEKSKKHIVALKEEVAKLQEWIRTKESSYKELHAQADAKIDKSLIKNLIVGYVRSNSNDQKRILKIIATVLDFSERESERVSLNEQQSSGWLASILSPQSSNVKHEQSLSAAFVRFLEDESRPKVLPNLLVSNQAKSGASSSTSSTPPRHSPSILSEVVLPTFVDFGKNRNSSSILKDVLKDNT